MTTINIGIVAHVDAGKTSLTERILYETHVIKEIGRVDKGTTLADSLDLEKRRGITISMSRKGNPYDNAACESFMKTLKYEEVHRNEYRDLAEARAAIHDFLEKVYNQKRLHSALGYLPPAEFERNLTAQRNKDAASRQLSS